VKISSIIGSLLHVRDQQHLEELHTDKH